MPVIEPGNYQIPGSRASLFSLPLGSPKASSTTAVHAAATGLTASAAGMTGTAALTISSGFSAPDVPRNITATYGGTSADIAPVAVTVYGTDCEGAAISETLPTASASTVGTKVGAKAFKTVTSFTIPAMSGPAATVSLGYGTVLGLGKRLTRNSVERAYFGGVLQSTAPTVAFHASNVANNTVELSTAPSAGVAVIVDVVQ